jgi:hypothetical protein
MSEAERRSWRMFAARVANPGVAGPFQRFGDERTVRYCGLEPVSVELVEDPDGPYWGWIPAADRRSRSGSGAPVMIQGHKGLFRMQSPDGFRGDIAAGRGEIVRMTCRAINETEGRQQ